MLAAIRPPVDLQVSLNASPPSPRPCPCTAVNVSIAGVPGQPQVTPRDPAAVGRGGKHPGNTHTPGQPATPAAAAKQNKPPHGNTGSQAHRLTVRVCMPPNLRHEALYTFHKALETRHPGNTHPRPARHRRYSGTWLVRITVRH